MKYVSTRGKSPAVGLGSALAAGLAPDGGLYMPAGRPATGPAEFADLESLPQIARRMLQPYFDGDPLADSLADICAEALDLPLPLRSSGDEHTWLLELFHGPTAAFKDFAARFLAAAMRRLPDAAATRRTVLVATSGDTGAAVAAAFHQRPGFDVVILYPDGKVSPRQAHQLGCFGDNVTTLRVAGSFDDCQNMVKAALSDPALSATLGLTSANSISLGRLLPQMSYYAAASLRHWRASGKKLGFVVPTGNLGNALACLMARNAGLPIGEIILANNANCVLSDYFAGQDYALRSVLPTLANAMDVGAPSNFERLRWLYPKQSRLRKTLAAGWVSDSEIKATIRTWNSRHGQVLCPHTATAACLLERRRLSGDDADYALVATAHPAKFESIVQPLVSAPVGMPPALARLLQRPASAQPFQADKELFKDWLLERAGAERSQA